jgi:hypothetical protein
MDKITKKNLEEMGFLQLGSSFNPTYFINDEIKKLFGFMVGQTKYKKWFIYKCYNGDCANKLKEVTCIREVVQELIWTSINYGKNIRSNEIKKLLLSND